MKKQKWKFLGIILWAFMLPQFVSAELACDSSTEYYVSKGNVYTYYINYDGNNNDPWPMRTYNTTAYGVSGIKTYCLDPMLKAPTTAVNRCERRIDPSVNPSPGTKEGDYVQAYDVAMVKAYEILYRDGRNTTSPADRVLGEIIFRWISSNYGQRDGSANWGNSYYKNNGDGTWTSSNSGKYISSQVVGNIFQAPFLTNYWNNGNAENAYAISVFGEAITAGNRILSGETYDELVKDGTLWADNYNFTTTTEIGSDGFEYITVNLEATNAPSSIYWSQFTGNCENKTVKCTIMERSGTGNSGKVVFQVHKTSEYDGKDYGIYVDSSYYDIRSGAANMIIVRQDSQRQRMLLVLDPELTIIPPPTRRRIPVRTNRCEKQSDGTYDYITYKDGKESSRKKVTDPNDMIKYSCPVYCQLLPDGIRTDAKYGWADQENYAKGNYYFDKADFTKYCGASCSADPANQVYHCGADYLAANPNKSDDTCTREEYNTYCSTTIQNVCRYDGNNYYCENGQVCDSSKFYNECCDNLDPSSEEYLKFCSCGDADINFIGACTEFNSNNSYLNSNVADVKDGAYLKYCLFNDHNEDKAGNSYEMTDQSSVSNNPYCKVSCIEEYEFELPNSQYTLSGSYFTLQTEVTGKRKCYVNAADNYDGIDRAKFDSDIEAKRKEIIDAYNEYAKWEAAASITSTAETLTCTYTGIPCGQNSSPSCIPCPGGSDSKTGYKKEWTWTYFDSDGNPYTGSDSYGPGTTTNYTCYCSIDAEANRDATHKSNRDAALATLNTKISEYNAIIQNFNNCSGVINSTSSNNINFPSITSEGWENNFKFDPLIKFEYDEPYQNMTGFNDTFELENTTVNSSEENYCSGDVGDTYNCNGSSSYSVVTLPKFVCTEAGCSTVNFSIGNSKFIIKEKTEGAVYKSKNDFSIYTPSGTIALNKDENRFDLYTNLCNGSEECLPISLNTPTGVFNFKFRYSQIGQFNDNNDPGRLVGEVNSVFNSVENEQEAGYVCHYVNNCPDCDYVCVGDNCDISNEDVNDEECYGECTYTCVNCIFDGSNNTFYYRTVSINNLFPNAREYGPNWDNGKGSYTKKQIEEEAEEIYGEPEYSYTITPQQMNRIREYNVSVGNYLNTTMPDGYAALECHEKSSGDGKKYKNIYCTSKFLDTGGNLYFTENARNDDWTLWPDSGFFTNNTRYSVTLGVGPSWR